jgi:thymidylate synthase
MAEQLPFILRELRRNPDSRRAVVDVRDWKHDAAEGNENPACLQHLQFFIRGGKLHLKILFRSNDACKATYMNAFALIMLQQRMAQELGVEMGTYTHRANSFHCYEKDFPLLEGYIRRLDKGEDVTYDYEGDWEEMMAEARGEIAAAVEKLKRGE